MRNIPSVKTLERAFSGKGKALRRLLQSENAVREHPAAIARIQECYHEPKLYDLRLHALNAELETFGVLNTGDSYGTTIIRFEDGRYRVGDWGTVVERGNYR